jgi:hypothetical protein
MFTLARLIDRVIAWLFRRADRRSAPPVPAARGGRNGHPSTGSDWAHDQELCDAEFDRLTADLHTDT